MSDYVRVINFCIIIIIIIIISMAGNQTCKFNVLTTRLTTEPTAANQIRDSNQATSDNHTV